MQDTILTGTEQAFIAPTRRAVLATIGPDGAPRLVPICFVLAEAADDLGRALIYSPIDDKPKASADPHDLGRVRDLLAAPSATVLVDRWSEDWARLGWIRLSGRARLLEPEGEDGEEHAAVVGTLRAKYPQYARHDLEGRPIIRIAIDRIQRWGDLAGGADA